MYCNSNSTVLSQPLLWNFNEHKVDSVVTYVMNGLLDKIEWSINAKRGINSNAVGYNREKYEQLENVYLMAYNGINLLEKNYILASESLDEIACLKNNWNGNGASSFSYELIEKCKRILVQLAAEPFVCPTACGSIQFEYEKENGDYLEFEVYEDRIEVFLDTVEKGEEEFNLQGISATDKMKQMVVDFYG